MSGLYLSRGLFPEEFLRPTVQFILECQRDSGEIPWFEGACHVVEFERWIGGSVRAWCESGGFY